MTGDNQSRNINIHGSVSQSVVNAGDNNTLTQQINQLGDTDAQQQLKALLLQLESAINAEPSLSEAEKAEALEEVKEIAAAGQAPDDGPMKKAAKRSIAVLKSMTLGVGVTTKFVEACNGLLPAIALLFSI